MLICFSKFDQHTGHFLSDLSCLRQPVHRQICPQGISTTWNGLFRQMEHSFVICFVIVLIFISFNSYSSLAVSLELVGEPLIQNNVKNSTAAMVATLAQWIWKRLGDVQVLCSFSWWWSRFASSLAHWLVLKKLKAIRVAKKLQPKRNFVNKFIEIFIFFKTQIQLI